MLDHGPHDREGRHRARIDGARLRLGAVRVARRQRPAGPVDGVRSAPASPRLEQVLGRELARGTTRCGTRGARRESALARRSRPPWSPGSSAASRPSSWTSRRTESIVKRSKCSAQRMNSCEKSSRMRRSGMRASSVSRSSVRAVTPRIVVPACERRLPPAKLHRRRMKSLPRGARRRSRLAAGAARRGPGHRPGTRRHPRVRRRGRARRRGDARRGASFPNLAALQTRGGYSPLTPDHPGADAGLLGDVLDGLDPGGHEIFDFLKRDPANRIPTFAVAEELQVPFLFGKNNPAAFAAGGVPAVRPSGPAARVAAPATRRGALSRPRGRRRRRRVPGGAGLAARDASLGPQQPARPRVLAGGRAPGRRR